MGFIETKLSAEASAKLEEEIKKELAKADPEEAIAMLRDGGDKDNFIADEDAGFTDRGVT